jgi:hypothetical protein
MADEASLEFLQRQQLDLLNEMKSMREDLGKSFRLMTDTQISIGRTLSALDRRRMELVGHRNVTGEELEKRAEELRAEMLSSLTELFDKRYAPKPQ